MNDTLTKLLIATLLISGCFIRSELGSQHPKALRKTSTLPAIRPGLVDNNSVWRDDSNNIILAQGGCIIEDKDNINGDDKFHWFGVEWVEGAGTTFAAVRHYTSVDLATWHRNTNAFSANSNFPAPKWVGRPFVMWNPRTGKYVMVIEKGKQEANPHVRNTYAFLTATSLGGSWTYQPSKLITGMPDSVDGAKFSLGDLGAYADDTCAYLMYTFDKNGTNHAQAIIKLAPDFMTPLPPSAQNYVEFTDQGSREAAGIFKKDNIYYYMTSQCRGWNSSATMYRTSGKIIGGWSVSQPLLYNPPSLTGARFSFNTQHDFVLPIYGKDTTTYVYFGDRWSNFYPGRPNQNPVDSGNNIGRYAWFPLSFVDTDTNSATRPVPQLNAPYIGTTATDGNGGDWIINTSTGRWSGRIE